MSLLPLVLETNAVSSSRLEITLTNPNAGSYIWYRIARPDDQRERSEQDV